mgnify:CR=1 FL=1
MFPAERIAELRNEMGIKQAELAEALNIGRSSISEYEKGNTQPSMASLLELADFFQVSLDYLLGRTDIKIPIAKLEEQLQTRCGQVPIDAIFQLNADQKEVIGLLLKTYMS